MFDSAYNKLPLKYNLEHILQVEDPDSVMRALELEEAKRADPAIGLFEMAVRSAEEAEDLEDEQLKDIKKIESKMLTERGVAVIRERKAPQQLPEKARVPTVEQPPRGRGLTPLLGGSELTPPGAF